MAYSSNINGQRKIIHFCDAYFPVSLLKNLILIQFQIKLISIFYLGRVTASNTLFTYKDGESSEDYQNLEFEPIFMEDVNSTKLEEAQATCGSDFACVYDLIATNDEKFAKYSKASNREADATRNSQSTF